MQEVGYGEMLRLLEAGEKRYRVATAPEAYIAWGADSTVFRSGDYAVKFYNGLLMRNNPNRRVCLNNYQKVTNLLSKYCLRHNLWVSVPESEEKAKLRINPLLAIGNSERFGCYVGASNFVKGPVVNRTMYDEENINLVADVHGHIMNFEREFGFKGMGVPPCNMKIITLGEEKVVMVTDLCPNIAKLSVPDTLI